MARKLAAAALFLVAAFMLIGFLGADASLGSPTQLLALFIAVVLPTAFGIMLWRGAGSSNTARMHQLREQTIDSEILRLAIARNGRLTVMEVSSTLGLSSADVQRSLDAMVRREAADVEVTEEGVLAYTFHDAKYLKGGMRGDG